MFECSVINRAQFKGSGNLRRFLSRLTNFLQHAVSARKRHLLHIRAAGCLKKKKRHVGGRATPPQPLYRAVFHRKTYICENRALQQIPYSLECHFARKSAVGCFQERAFSYFVFLQRITSSEVLLLFCLLCSGIDSFSYCLLS